MYTSAFFLILNWFRCRSAMYFTSREARVALRLFPHDLHRIAVLCHGEWRVGGNRRGWQRRLHRCRPVHGWRHHAESGGRAKRRLRLPAACWIYAARGQPKRFVAPLVATLYPGADYPDGADGSVQSASFAGSATLPLAVVKP